MHQSPRLIYFSVVRSPSAKWQPEAFNTIPNYDAIATAESCTWSWQSAKHAITFIETLCRYTQGEWEGRAFALFPWQRALVGNLYGWLRPDGTRRYRQCHLLIPRKSGKTELASALALYHLLADDEPTPSVIGIARDRNQARLCLDRACRMAINEPRLKAKTQQFQMALTAPETYGSYKVLSSDAPSAHGLNVSACIADEIHAMENRKELWEAVMTSMGARRQPMMISITTAGTLRESLEYELFDYGTKVCQRVINNPAFLPCLHYAPPEADWTSKATWKQANPSLGLITTNEWYSSEAQKAKELPSYETPFRTYYLCQHVSASDRWVRMSDWDACKTEFDVTSLHGLPCYIGLDLAQTTDISSVTAVWIDGDSLWVKNWNYAPEEGARQRSRRDAVPYEDWARRGYMTLTSGDVTDYSFIATQIEALCLEHKVKMVAYDPYNAQNIANNLETKGINVVRVPQSFLNLSSPTRMWESAVVSHKLHHDGNPVLTWAMSNVVVDKDANGNFRPSKKRSVERIDPVVAGIIALSASLADDSLAKHVYEKRGIVWF